MKATSKFRPPHPSAERPLQGVRGIFLSVIVRMPTLHHQMFHIFFPFYAVLESSQKCALLRAKGLKGRSSLASQPYFFRARRKTGEGEGKSTSGNLRQVFVPPAGMLAEPMKLQNVFMRWKQRDLHVTPSL